MYQIDVAGSYTGPDRRKWVRRQAHSERREMIRFEPGKLDRRGETDRRQQRGWDHAGAR